MTLKGTASPGNGWSLKTTNSSFTWYSGKQTNLNATKVARVDFDEYEYEDWSQAGLSPLGTGAKQDEYLITPAVNLTGKTLDFEGLTMPLAAMPCSMAPSA